mgnify:FL=1
MEKKKRVVGKNKKKKGNTKYVLKKGRKFAVKEGTALYEATLQLQERKILANVSQKPYFHKDDFVLYQGDCLKILEELPENSIDMVFADPPYNLSNGGFTVHAGW